MAEGRSTYPRAQDEFYVEPPWCVALLLHHVDFNPGAYDPTCGLGTIPSVLRQSGLETAGSDIVDRADGEYPTRDFLSDAVTSDYWPNIIMNPPYRHCAEFITRGIDEVRPSGRVAALVPLKFLASQGRHALFTQPATELVLVLSRRPSIPPGKLLREYGEAVRKGGSIDFCWVVFRKGKNAGGCELKWAM